MVIQIVREGGRRGRGGEGGKSVTQHIFKGAIKSLSALPELGSLSWLFGETRSEEGGLGKVGR